MTSAMRALVYTAVKKVDLQDIPRPVAGAGQVLIAVEMAGICGSDMTGFLGHSPRRQPPLVLGHEVIGHAAHVPAGDWPFKEGDRVVANPLQGCGQCPACRSGRTNICPDWKLIGMDREAGAFAE